VTGGSPAAFLSTNVSFVDCDTSAHKARVSQWGPFHNGRYAQIDLLFR